MTFFDTAEAHATCRRGRNVTRGRLRRRRVHHAGNGDRRQCRRGLLADTLAAGESGSCLLNKTRCGHKFHADAVAAGRNLLWMRVERAAEGLGVEQIDLYQIHMPDVVQPGGFLGLSSAKKEATGGAGAVCRNWAS